MAANANFAVHVRQSFEDFLEQHSTEQTTHDTRGTDAAVSRR